MEINIEEYLGTATVHEIAEEEFRNGVRSGDVPSPYTVKIPGLGRLVYEYGNLGDNWAVL